MPYYSEMIGRYRVEAENTRITLRFFDENFPTCAGERTFACEVTTSGPKEARITNGSGLFNMETCRSLRSWLAMQGYTQFSYERADGRVRSYRTCKA